MGVAAPVPQRRAECHSRAGHPDVGSVWLRGSHRVRHPRRIRHQRGIRQSAVGIDSGVLGALFHRRLHLRAGDLSLQPQDAAQTALTALPGWQPGCGRRVPGPYLCDSPLREFFVRAHLCFADLRRLTPRRLRRGDREWTVRSVCYRPLDSGYPSDRIGRSWHCPDGRGPTLSSSGGRDSRTRRGWSGDR